MCLMMWRPKIAQVETFMHSVVQLVTHDQHAATFKLNLKSFWLKHFSFAFQSHGRDQVAYGSLP